MTGRHIAFVTAVSLACGIVLMGQAQTQTRRIDFTGRPIVEALRPTDRHVVIHHPVVQPATATPEELGVSLVEVLVEYNPIILIGRLVQKRPEFLTLKSRQDFTVVPMASANWVGSRQTVIVEQVIQTTDELPLIEGDRLAFIEDGDGSAIINGTRVDAETSWLWPTEEGKRYLITGRWRNNWFVASGMWLEPSAGAALRIPTRRPPQPALGLPLSTPEPSELDGMNIYEVADRLEEEVAKRKKARR